MQFGEWLARIRNFSFYEDAPWLKRLMEVTQPSSSLASVDDLRAKLVNGSDPGERGRLLELLRSLELEWKADEQDFELKKASQEETHRFRRLVLTTVTSIFVVIVVIAGLVFITLARPSAAPLPATSATCAPVACAQQAQPLPVVLPPPADAKSPPTAPLLPLPILAAWVQIIPVDLTCTGPRCQARALLRTVVPPSANCALIARFIRTQEPVPLQERGNPRPERFPVKLCEAALPLNNPGVLLADGSTRRWPKLDEAAPSKVIIIGDTGCRNSDGQDCTRAVKWPLHLLAAKAASLEGGPPDFVIHVGDYRYRDRDDWAAWQADFFEPMRPLLESTPWVMARGNHETCFQKGDAGDGWAFLLAPTPGRIPFCTWDDRVPLRIDSPYAVDLTDLRLVVTDTADAYYNCQRWAATFTANYQGNLSSLLEESLQGPRGLWMISHYPIFELRTTGKCESQNSYAPFRRLLAAGIKPDQVDTVLSGDVHGYQVLRVNDGDGKLLTVQIVAGHGGAFDEKAEPPARPPVAGGLEKPVTCHIKRVPVPEGEPGFSATSRIANEFGFLVATRDGGPKQWLIQPRAASYEAEQMERACRIPATAKSDCLPAEAEPLPDCG